MGDSALLFTEEGYANVDPLMIHAHVESLDGRSIEIVLDRAHPVLEAYEEEDDT